MDLLGNKEGVKKKPEKPKTFPVEVHIPSAELAKKEAEKTKEDKIEAPMKLPDDNIDLAEEEKRKAAIRKKVLYTILIILILVGAGSGIYLLATRAPLPNFTGSLPPGQVVTTLPITPTPTQPAPVVAPTVPGEAPPTALAPLRGSLVQFSQNGDLYLIENNGELRLVDKNGTIFKNGQRISQLNKTLIYLLPEKWSVIRKSSVGVSGQVDWDPRVLTVNELLPFIQ